jgi:hypothetical protein
LKKLNVRPLRPLSIFLTGFLFLTFMMLMAFLRLRLSQAGIGGWLAQSATFKPIKVFGIHYILKILLPVYLFGGCLAWFASLLPGAIVKKNWLKDWKSREAVYFGLSSMLWIHIVLWWQVPTALWVFPGIRNLPFWVIFIILLIMAVTYPIIWLVQQKTTFLFSRTALLVLWLVSWTLLAYMPRFIPRPAPRANGGEQQCKVLMLGIDGLRSDTFLSVSDGLKGTRFENSYTVIPATRLLWHILWGGDPMKYTIGHIGATLEEFQNPHNLVLLRVAMGQGWKPRFYIDDGGTIGLTGRQMDLDDHLMPAAGWENFVNSNLAVSFPMYAIWENWFKAFPTTNPWSSMDAGLRETLRLGRGSAWVMFHSCLAHQPIFLTRQELQKTGSWFKISPWAYEPLVHIDLVQAHQVENYDARTNPYSAYKIRMESIVSAWQKIWNRLDDDTHYRNSVRILFSDHGERFHNVFNGFQLQGVHGYNLDPWECRTAMIVDGPGFRQSPGSAPKENSISLMSIRAALQDMLDNQSDFSPLVFENSFPVSPIRYHTIATSAFGRELLNFREEKEKNLAANSYIAPNGIWYIEYKRSAEERAKDASVGYAEGAISTYFKPIEGGGALKTQFDKYTLIKHELVSEEDFQLAKAKVERILMDATLSSQNRRTWF